MKRFILLLVIYGFVVGDLYAKVPTTCHKIRLKDNWEFLRQDVGNIWELVRPVKKGQPEEQPIWTQVTLPHCFNAEDAVDPNVNYYQGPGWYRTCLKLNNPYQNGRVLLEFEGAGQKTDVYIYMTKVGSHVGGYDSWNVDITDAVQTFLLSKDAERFGGKIPLSIRCDNTRDAEMVPSDLSDFNLYGGIYRYLNLVYLPEVSVASLKIVPTLDTKMKKASLDISGLFYNPTDIRQASVEVFVKNPQGKIVYAQSLGDVTPLGEFSIQGINLDNPYLWDVISPQLYTCEVVVTANGQKMTVMEKFGFRSFEFIEKGPFFLNGKRLLLRGTHRHEDHAGVGAAMTEEQMIQEMKMMKDMGVNFIRLGHYQQSEIILNLCDELGILVWEEIPWCRGGVGNETYRRQTKRMLNNMIIQHYNHPSVIIWGLGNENDWPNDFPVFKQNEIRKLMSELNTIAHQLDKTRKTAIRRCDFCSDIVDVYSPSIWAGWYRGNYTDYQKMSKEEMEKVRHFLHVEWGGDSHAGRHAEAVAPLRKEGEVEGDAALNGSALVLKKGDWSETYIVKLIDWHLKEQENMPWLTGTAYWPFKDFSTPVRPANPIPYVNQKGVIERDFTPKESYYVFQSYWTKKPMLHIYGHSWPVRWGNDGDEKEILVYSNCSKVELFVNGESQGIHQRDSQDFPAAGLRWNVKLKNGLNTLRAVTVDTKESLTDELTFEYQTEKWGKATAFQVKATPLKSGIIKVEAQLVDDKGIRCLDSREFIYFDIAGDGKLIQNQGTVTGSRKIQARNGRAQILVQTHQGTSCVAVKANNIQTSFITVK
ncbi:glycosyl hydrolase family 2 TIM barrel domain protein [Bacteroides clarus CAG:160]|uniref:glycoside hydrolase family 2 TIM barrel-domain containing protein n=1 Tax=Bacteroides TaxID=816 RepID=UPI00033CB80C|nr:MULTISPECIES: glycoside hydrolase family 2 TIM barrel-domain containing protein [Bacteroides]CDB83582.1 glycosyl hydrolase family 2 TIM barrel domain protein [Bacteroides clarus CAG:160]